MRLSRQISMLCVLASLSGCVMSPESSDLRRNCSIGLINVPVEELTDLRVTADAFNVEIDALRGAGESRGGGETIYEWWPAIDAPSAIEFILTFKDGVQISQSQTIETSIYNRFGIDGVYLVNNKGNYTIELRYGIVSEYDRSHSGSINTWFFAPDGGLTRFSHDQHLRTGQIGLYYTNATGKVILTQATRYIDRSAPRITLRYNDTGILDEIEIYHWDKPAGLEIFYAPDSTVRKVTRDRNIYHPGGVLLRDVIKDDVTDQPELYSEYRFPDISFTNQITFDPAKELAIRNIELTKQDL